MINSRQYKKDFFHRHSVNLPIMIAPMVGLSHVAFRELIHHYIPKGLNILCFTEMLSTRRVPHENIHTTLQLLCYDNEAFFVPQLLGNNESDISLSIKKLMSKNPWGFDINMGCPVSHVLKHNWGVRLLGDSEYAAQVVTFAKRHSPIPVSVKLRGGLDENMNLPYLDEFTSKLEKAGADWLTIHARPRGQGHKGLANWDIPGELARRRAIPVVANGDIQSVSDIQEVLEVRQCDGAMLARAAVAKPWLVWQYAQSLGWPLPPPHFIDQKAPETGEEEGKEFGRAALLLLNLLAKHFHDETEALQRFSFFLATAAKWYQFGHAFWKLSTSLKTMKEAKERVEDFVLRYENPSCQSRVKFI